MQQTLNHQNAPNTILKEASNVPIPMPRSILKSESIKVELNEIINNWSKSNPKYYKDNQAGQAKDPVRRDEDLKNQIKSAEPRNMIQEYKEKSKSALKIFPSEFKLSEEEDVEDINKTQSNRKKHRRRTSANVFHPQLEPQETKEIELQLDNEDIISVAKCVHPHTISAFKTSLKPYIGEAVETKVSVVALGVIIVGIAVYFARAAKLVNVKYAI